MTSDGSPQRVTILDVARQAAVSRQTVSNALTHPGRVHPDTLERVMAAIDELGYQPSSSAQSLRSQRAGALGVEVNTLGRGSHNETMAPFLASLGMRAGLHGTHVVPFGSPENSPMLDGYRQMWARRLVDAFVIADTHHGDPRPPWLEGNGIPFASFGRVWDDPTNTRWVDVDGAAGTRAAVAHCVAAGYRTVAYLGWPHGSIVGDDRRHGWELACAARRRRPRRPRGHRRAGPRRRPGRRARRCCARSGRATRSSARPTSSPSACTTSCSPPGCGRASTSASSASTAPRPP